MNSSWPECGSLLLCHRAGQPSHPSQGHLEPMAAQCGVRVEFLPPYSPEYNPIEHLFFKLKQWMRANNALPTAKAAIVAALDAVTADKCWHRAASAILASNRYAKAKRPCSAAQLQKHNCIRCKRCRAKSDKLLWLPAYPSADVEPECKHLSGSVSAVGACNYLNILLFHAALRSVIAGVLLTVLLETLRISPAAVARTPQLAAIVVTMASAAATLVLLQFEGVSRPASQELSQVPWCLVCHMQRISRSMNHACFSTPKLSSGASLRL